MTLLANLRATRWAVPTGAVIAGAVVFWMTIAPAPAPAAWNSVGIFDWLADPLHIAHLIGALIAGGGALFGAASFLGRDAGPSSADLLAAEGLAQQKVTQRLVRDQRYELTILQIEAGKIPDDTFWRLEKALVENKHLYNTPDATKDT